MVLTAVVVAIAAAALFGVPVALVSQSYVAASHVERVDEIARNVARTFDTMSAQGAEVSPDAIAQAVPPGDRVVVLRHNEPVLDLGPVLEGAAVTTGAAVAADGTIIRVSERGTAVASDTEQLRLLLVGFGLTALVIATALGVWHARRISRPLSELAGVAEQIGSGDQRALGRRYGVAELDRIADVLDRSTERIREMLAAERQLSQDASHQLRTPLTALSMRLEEILATDDSDVVRTEAKASLDQVERLTQVVDRLLTADRVHRAAGQVTDVDASVHAQVAEWRRAFTTAHRSIVADGVRGLTVRITPGTLTQVLSILIENALVHGAGTVRVHRRVSPTSVTVEVSDEGRGVPEGMEQR
ncbi:MAG: HAMP domain-containing sensor histidine kinase, partial [Jiangellaceae bacterium]